MMGFSADNQEKSKIRELNEKVLDERRPKLKKTLDLMLAQDFTSVDILINKNNEYTARVISKNTGREVIFSKYKNNDVSKVVDDLSLKAGELRFHIGFGFGEIALEIVKRNLSKHKIIIVEPRAKIFDAAMDICDLRPLLESEKIEFLIGDSFNLRPILEQNKVAIYSVGVYISTFEPSRELNPNKHEILLRSIKESVQNIMGEISSEKHLALHSFKNITSNYSVMKSSANMGCLKGLMKGLPGIVVGAGPSLQEQVEILKKYMNKAVIVSVDSALPVLLKNDVRPHFVVSVDYSEACYEKFREVRDKINNIPFCYTPAVNPLAVKLFPSKYKFFLNSNFGLAYELRSEWGKFAVMPSMQAVGHLAFYTADILGVKEIILCGFDMAYTGFVSHAKGMSLPRSINFEKVEWVEGIDGNMVPTMFQMIGQKALMEDLIKNTDKHCYNANKNGAKIKGVSSCNLEDFLKKTKTIDFSIHDRIASTFDESKKPILKDLISFLNKRYKQIKTLQLTSLMLIKEADKVMMHIDKKGKDAQLIKKVKKLLNQHDEFINDFNAKNMGEMLHFLAQEEIDHMAREFLIEIKDGEKDAVFKVRKEICILKDSITIRNKAIKQMLFVLDSFIQRLKSEENIRFEDLLTAPRELKDVKKFIKWLLDYGDYLDAEILCEKLLGTYDLDIKKFFTVSLMKQKLYKKAFQFLSKNERLKNEYPELMDDILKWANNRIIQGRAFLGNIDSAAGTLPWSKKAAEEVLEIFPAHKEGLKLLEKVKDQEKKFFDETKSQVEFLKLDIDEGILLIDKLLRDENFEKAEKCLKVFMKKYPGNPTIRFKSAVIKKHKGATKEALDLIYQSLSIDPTNLNFMLEAGVLLAETGAFDDSYGYLNKVVSMSPDNFRYLHEVLGDLCFERSEYKKSLVHYENMFVFFPSRFDILKKIALVYKRMGLTEAYMESLEQFKKLDTENNV